MNKIIVGFALGAVLATILIGIAWVETMPNDPKLFLLFAAGVGAILWVAEKIGEFL